MIFDLSKTSIPENNRIWVIWALKKEVFHGCRWKYLFTWGKQIPKTYIVEKIYEKVSLSNCDLWSCQNWHCIKQQNPSYLSHIEKSTSLLLLKIPFLHKIDTCLKLTWQKNSWKGVAFNVWFLISPKSASPNTTESELFEP